MTDLALNIPNDYSLTDGEIDNIVYLTCKYTINWPMRQADKAVCQMMMNKNARGPEQVKSLLEVTCEYLWDHMLGEPKEPTPKQFFEHMVPMLNEWFSTTTQEERTKTD